MAGTRLLTDVRPSANLYNGDKPGSHDVAHNAVAQPAVAGGSISISIGPLYIARIKRLGAQAGQTHGGERAVDRNDPGIHS